MTNINPLRSARRTLRSLLAGTALAASLVATSLVATADATENSRPRIHTNQQFLEDLALNNTLKVNDALSVFRWCSKACPTASRSIRPRTTTTSSSTMAA